MTTLDTAAAEQPTIEERRAWARDAIHRFLGNPSGQAQDMVATLNDSEVDQLNLAAASQTPRDGIKDVFTANYERRRKLHEQEAAERQAKLSQRASATKMLIRVGMRDDEAREAVGHLTEGEQSILAALAGETDTDGIVIAILDRARSRVMAAAEEATKDAGTVEVKGEETGTTTTVSPEAGTLVADHDPAKEQEHMEAAATPEPASPEPASEGTSTEPPPAEATPAPQPVPPPASSGKKSKGK